MVVLPRDVQRVYDMLINEGIERGFGQGFEKGIEQGITAVNMIKNGFSLEDASLATGLSKDQIIQLCKAK